MKLALADQHTQTFNNDLPEAVRVLCPAASGDTEPGPSEPHPLPGCCARPIRASVALRLRGEPLDSNDKGSSLLAKTADWLRPREPLVCEVSGFGRCGRSFDTRGEVFAWKAYWWLSSVWTLLLLPGYRCWNVKAALSIKTLSLVALCCRGSLASPITLSPHSLLSGLKSLLIARLGWGWSSSVVEDPWPGRSTSVMAAGGLLNWRVEKLADSFLLAFGCWPWPSGKGLSSEVERSSLYLCSVQTALWKCLWMHKHLETGHT